MKEKTREELDWEAEQAHIVFKTRGPLIVTLIVVVCYAGAMTFLKILFG